ncbi:hypothetical protein [Streptomyces sp. NPDC008125]|uniref:hypothetical protein n=1 Tax=Streptomyces sp. NPDC008125 TaxID=3364811 RepID=UPI0036EF6699
MPGIDLDTCQRDGYQLLPGLLAEEDIGRAVGFFDHLDGAAEVASSYEPEYDEADGVRRLRKLRRLLWNDPRVWGPMLNRAGVPELAREVVGDGAAVVFHPAFLTPALVGTAVALHQDQALWTYEYPKAFSVWCAPTKGMQSAHGQGLFGLTTQLGTAITPAVTALLIVRQGWIGRLVMGALPAAAGLAAPAVARWAERTRRTGIAPVAQASA